MKLVEAETFYGGFYGLGFVHAIDRLWQIEFYRKVSLGRISEVLGDETIPIDKYMRTRGMHRIVDRQFELLDEEEILVYENYAAGVNKAVENMHSYPPEFYLLWSDFETFTSRDALGMVYLMTVFCTGDWYFELMRERLTEVYP
jgi:acyl-homoserine lactone acylase PvdQ